MKIGIITFHRAVNYGAILQLWALYTYLRNIGHDVFVIDYRCQSVEDTYKIISFDILRRKKTRGKIDYLLSHIMNIWNIRSRNIKFNSFLQEKFNFLSVNQIPTMDIVIAGSDQIWNPYLTNGLDEFYTLQNCLFDKVRKIGYAISGEPSCFSQDTLKEIGEIVNSFNYFSVREKNLCNLFQKYTYKKISLCVDPTLLLSSETWGTLKFEKVINEKYLFVYQVIQSPITMQIADSLAKRKGLKLIYLNSKYSIRWKEKNIKRSIGPVEFISLIQYADFVITTSFHGTALSLVMKKQFAVIETSNMNRQKELLKILSLDNRIIKQCSDICKAEYFIEYDKINVKTVSLISQRFLKESCHD